MPSKSRLSFYKPTTNVRTVPVQAAEIPRSVKSSFLALPVDIRLQIYQYAFNRSPVEHFESLHFGPGRNSSSALALVSKQIHSEVRDLYDANAIIELWTPHRGNANDEARKLLMRAWKGSPSDLRLRYRPETIKLLAIRINSIRDADLVSKQFIESKYLRDSRFKPTDLYIRVCICGALRILHERPENVLSFCRALEVWAQEMHSLERIHVLYCGQQWPVWIQALGDVPFPDIVVKQHEAAPDDGWKLEIANARDGQEEEGHDTVEQELHDDGCRLRTRLTSKPTLHMKAFDKPTTQRTITVDYFDSWTTLKERCVLNKPPRQGQPYPALLEDRE